MKGRRNWRSLDGTFRLIPAAILVAFVLTGSPAAVLSGSSPVSYGPHAFMAEPDRCAQCHISFPVRPGGGMVRDIVTLCNDCHFENHRMSHPVDIRPGRKPAPSLPLDFEGSITCATCHDPHSEPVGASPRVRLGFLRQFRGVLSGEGYPTYFLRMPNTEGQLCRECHTGRELGPGLAELGSKVPVGYTGSRACAICHAEIYRQWSRTPHAMTIGDPRVSPNAVEAVFSGDESFGPEDVVLSIGTHWNQRYVVDRGGRLMVAKGVWSLADGKWAPSYWKEQPWREKCSGCHLTGYDPLSGRLAENGVGCEMCHGPGRLHVGTHRSEDIINPARLSDEKRESICASCHTLGHDRTGEFRFPLGFVPGEDLGRFYLGLIPRPGQGSDTFKGDGSLQDRLGSFSYWKENFFRHDRFACKLCKGSVLTEPVQEAEDGYGVRHHCLHCHVRLIGTDTYHDFADGPDTDCFLCHKPMTDRNGRPSIHDHKFVFTREMAARRNLKGSIGFLANR